MSLIRQFNEDGSVRFPKVDIELTTVGQGTVKIDGVEFGWTTGVDVQGGRDDDITQVQISFPIERVRIHGSAAVLAHLDPFKGVEFMAIDNPGCDCPACGSLRLVEAKFCYRCGAELPPAPRVKLEGRANGEH